MNGSKPAEILLIGLGSIGAVYAHILERVREPLIGTGGDEADC